MTDNEIIKELQAASEWFTEHGRNTNTAIIGICDRAIELINRQKAEISVKRKLLANADAMIEALAMERDQLESDVSNAIMNLEHLQYEFDLLKQEKSVVIAEAVKEFAERLKEECGNVARMEFGGFTYFCVGYEFFDNLVKEFTEAHDD